MDGITGLSSDADRKSIEKHRLRLELQHRRKVQKLRQRLENRKRKQAGVSNVIIVSSSPASADAASAAAAVSTTIPDRRVARRHSLLSTLVESNGTQTALQTAESAVKNNDIGLSEREISELKLQDRLRDRQIAMLKQRQTMRKKTNKRSNSDTSALRHTAFGAAAAREMGTLSRSQDIGALSRSQPYSDSGKSDLSTDFQTFTMHDINYLKDDDDFDIFLEAAESQNELEKFENMYGFEDAPKKDVDTVHELADDKKSGSKKKEKKSYVRQSSFATELDDLLKDIL